MALSSNFFPLFLLSLYLLSLFYIINISFLYLFVLLRIGSLWSEMGGKAVLFYFKICLYNFSKTFNWVQQNYDSYHVVYQASIDIDLEQSLVRFDIFCPCTNSNILHSCHWIENFACVSISSLVQQLHTSTGSGSRRGCSPSAPFHCTDIIFIIKFRKV